MLNMVFCTSSKGSNSPNEDINLKEIYAPVKLNYTGRNIIQTQVGGKKGRKMLGRREKHELKDREVRHLIIYFPLLFMVAVACYRVRYVQTPLPS